ncbi:diaminopimelate epimerase [Candidatus Pseudothioglobus sp. Uisw_016]|uniref:diaminopimelate epimerase n=1 Tax=Candidatus Pseudothioglobus sp. Uisw_016 TaxID=3230995 RepID=UPI003A88A079
MIYFTKMHGLGNDFVIIDNIDGNVSLSTEEIRKLSDRRFGVGFDQLLMVESALSKDADFRYVIFNADGSEVSQCGNGARCFALYIHKKNLSYKNPLSVETNDGIMILTVNSDDSVRVEMGEPNFIPSIIPLNVNEEGYEYIIEGFKVGSLSIGNPHAILILDDISDIDSTALKIQSSSLFPEGVNVGFMKVLSKDEVQLRVVERGVGETLACGSGACAAVIQGIRLGLLNSKVKVRLNGGNAMVEYDGQKVYLTGPGEFVYEGSINLRSAPS